MNETDASEEDEDAREYIKYLIRAAWKKMNKDQVVSSTFSQIYIEIAMMAQCMT